MRTAFLSISLLTFLTGFALADERPTEAEIRTAIDKSLPLLVAAAKGSMEQRKQCFTCHNQGMAIAALAAAKTRGFAIDEEHLKLQVEFTAGFLAKNAAEYREGKGQGGQADTAGFALWALDNGGWKPDETTSAVAEYLLRYQSDLDHWTATSRRPPTENSDFTTSYVSLRGLSIYGGDEQRERIEKRFEQLRAWLASGEGKGTRETEDRVFRLRSLALLKFEAAEVKAAAEELLKTQRDDGGWGQLDELASDAYATGSALAALHEVGGLATSDGAYGRGLAWLVKAQLPDGSWKVESRSKPFQTYFESGYPHGKNQFISCAAAGWATIALTHALPAP